MKRLFIALTLAFFSFSMSSFAADITVNNTILRAFNRTFVHATDVSWSQAGEFVVARFREDNRLMHAYYNNQNELTVVAESILIQTLSAELQYSLLKKYAGYTISDLYKIDDEDSTKYFAVVESASQKVILRARANDWDVLKSSVK